MMIQSSRHQYSVLYSRKTGRQSMYYECVDYEAGSGRFDLVALQSVSNGVKEFLAELTGYTDFEELEECFQGQQKYYVALKPPAGRLLKEKLQLEKCGLKERAMIGKALLEHMVIQSMPLFFLADGIRQDHVWIDAAQGIHFQYELKTIEQFEKTTLAEVGKALDDWIKALFAGEVKYKGLTELEEYRAFLQKGEYSTCLELYDGYQILYKRFMELTDSEAELSLPSRKEQLLDIWEKTYEHIHVIVGVGGLLILAGLILALILYKERDKEPMDNGFTNIGTVRIREGVQEND